METNLFTIYLTKLNIEQQINGKYILFFTVKNKLTYLRLIKV